MLNFKYVHQRKQRWIKKVLDETNQNIKEKKKGKWYSSFATKLLIFVILDQAKYQNMLIRIIKKYLLNEDYYNVLIQYLRLVIVQSPW